MLNLRPSFSELEQLFSLVLLAVLLTALILPVVNCSIDLIGLGVVCFVHLLHVRE